MRLRVVDFETTGAQGSEVIEAGVVDVELADGEWPSASRRIGAGHGSFFRRGTQPALAGRAATRCIRTDRADAIIERKLQMARLCFLDGDGDWSSKQAATTRTSREAVGEIRICRLERVQRPSTSRALTRFRHSSRAPSAHP